MLNARQVTLIIAGLLGAAGVALAAASAHVPNGQAAQSAAYLLIMHATAATAILAVSFQFENRSIFRVSTALMLLGSTLFAADIALRAFGIAARLFPNAAPLGGILMIAGWLILTLAAIISSRPKN